jgi:hypothetical protein
MSSEDSYMYAMVIKLMMHGPCNVNNPSPKIPKSTVTEVKERSKDASMTTEAYLRKYVVKENQVQVRAAIA